MVEGLAELLSVRDVSLKRTGVAPIRPALAFSREKTRERERNLFSPGKIILKKRGKKEYIAS